MNPDVQKLIDLVIELSGTLDAEHNGNDMSPRTSVVVSREAYVVAKRLKRAAKVTA